MMARYKKCILTVQFMLLSNFPSINPIVLLDSLGLPAVCSVYWKPDIFNKRGLFPSWKIWSHKNIVHDMKRLGIVIHTHRMDTKGDLKPQVLVFTASGMFQKDDSGQLGLIPGLFLWKIEKYFVFNGFICSSYKSCRTVQSIGDFETLVAGTSIFEGKHVLWFKVNSQI